MSFDLPSESLLVRQSERLSALRSRILRRLSIARLGPVLDLGAGHGAVVGELVRRSRGPVVALDRRLEPFRNVKSFAGALCVRGDGISLPFSDSVFAFVHLQLVFLWQKDPAALASEIVRVLHPGGSILAIEPDFGALMEWPESVALRGLWMHALERAGADPRVGRKLPVLLSSLGLKVRVDLLNGTSEADADRFELLGGLPLTTEEQERLEVCRIEDKRLSGERKLVHLPYVFTSASRP